MREKSERRERKRERERERESERNPGGKQSHVDLALGRAWSAGKPSGFLMPSRRRRREKEREER